MEEKVIKSAEDEKKLQQHMQEVAAPFASVPAPTTPDLWSYRTLSQSSWFSSPAPRLKRRRGDMQPAMPR